MTPIVFHEGLLACDRLLGKELEAGEWLLVRFPDGTTEKHQVIILSEHFDRESGHPLELRRHRAFFVVPLHGTTRWITAAGLEAERL